MMRWLAYKGGHVTVPIVRGGGGEWESKTGAC